MDDKEEIFRRQCVASRVWRDANERRKIAARRRWNRVEILKRDGAPSGLGRRWRDAIVLNRMCGKPNLSFGYGRSLGKTIESKRQEAKNSKTAARR